MSLLYRPPPPGDIVLLNVIKNIQTIDTSLSPCRRRRHGKFLSWLLALTIRVTVKFCSCDGGGGGERIISLVGSVSCHPWKKVYQDRRVCVKCHHNRRRAYQKWIDRLTIKYAGRYSIAQRICHPMARVQIPASYVHFFNLYSTTDCENCQVDYKECGKVYKSSVDLSAPTILLPRVQIPSKTCTIFSILFDLWSEKDENKQKEAGIGNSL